MEVWLLAALRRRYQIGLSPLVYLDAYIPQDGKSVFDLIPGLKEIYEKKMNERRRQRVACNFL
jgi:hypothetical protein